MLWVGDEGSLLRKMVCELDFKDEMRPLRGGQRLQMRNRETRRMHGLYFVNGLFWIKHGQRQTALPVFLNPACVLQPLGALGPP